MHRMMRSTGLALTAAVLLAACSKKDDAAVVDTSAAIAPAPEPAPVAAPAVTDPQIAAIVVAANNAEIEGGKQVAKKSTNAKVKEFAQRMVTDHGGVNKAATDLVTKLNVTPEESDASRAQTAAGEKSRSDLAAMSGAEFDRAYIANEVTYHEQLLNAIDILLMPAVQNAELKTLLTNTRPAVIDHLRHAKELQTSLK